MNTSQALTTILQELAAQRNYRERKRNEYLRRFQTLKQQMGVGNQVTIRHHPLPEPLHQGPRQEQGNVPQHPSSETGSRVPPTIVNPLHHEEFRASSAVEQPLSAQEQELARQNQKLKEVLVKLQQNKQQQMEVFSSAIDAAKKKYMAEIQRISEVSDRSKQEIVAKMQKLKEQTEGAILKNQEIEAVNASIKKELENAENGSQGAPSFDQIRKDYDQKIASFQAVFDSSNEKIEAMEKEFNEEQFINSTLGNEELMTSLQQNAKKAEEAAKILEDYCELSQGKQEILVELQASVEMKEKEIAKMCELEEKIKTIMQRLAVEKRSIANENDQMARELMEIKDLLMATVNPKEAA